MAAPSRVRIAVAALTLSVAGFGAWKAQEGGGPVTVRNDGVEVLHPTSPRRGTCPRSDTAPRATRTARA